ncbi:hypothetical protein TruAng_010853 [Truncatella angustata]|nr:hypothetical protein TruAng_010853 [Truncatella angustata]
MEQQVKHYTSLAQRMPRSGLIYESQHAVFGRNERDRLVVAALYRANVQIAGQGVHCALVTMFRNARAFLANWDTSMLSIYDIFEPIKIATTWADSITIAFANPRYPEDPTQHAAIAHEVDTLGREVGTAWLWSEFQTFSATGGMDASADKSDGDDFVFKICKDHFGSRFENLNLLLRHLLTKAPAFAPKTSAYDMSDPEEAAEVQ